MLVFVKVVSFPLTSVIRTSPMNPQVSGHSLCIIIINYNNIIIIIITLCIITAVVINYHKLSDLAHIYYVIVHGDQKSKMGL